MAIVIDLASFSSSTHLAALVVLKPDYFKHIVRLRAFGMVATLMLLIVGNFTLGDRFWYDSFTCPLQCVILNWNPGGIQAFWMTFSIVFLTVTYVSLLTRMFERTQQGEKNLEGAMCEWFNGLAPNPNNFVLRSFLALHELVGYSVSCAYYLYSSYVFDVVLNFGWFGYNIWGLKYLVFVFRISKWNVNHSLNYSYR